MLENNNNKFRLYLLANYFILLNTSNNTEDKEVAVKTHILHAS